MKKKINKIKQKSSKHKIITNTWIEHSTESAHTETWDKAFQAGKVFTKKNTCAR